jgi:hypothetical protein
MADYAGALDQGTTSWLLLRTAAETLAAKNS